MTVDDSSLPPHGTNENVHWHGAASDPSNGNYPGSRVKHSNDPTSREVLALLQEALSRNGGNQPPIDDYTNYNYNKKEEIKNVFKSSSLGGRRRGVR